MGRWIILAGVILVAIGMAVQFTPWLLRWFGRLPGDIRIETEHSMVFIPVSSMIVVSIVMTVLMNVLRR